MQNLQQVAKRAAIFAALCYVFKKMWDRWNSDDEPPSLEPQQSIQPAREEKLAQPSPAAKEEPPASREMTVAELKNCDGKDNGPMYIALKGRIFDVESNKPMYEEGSDYHHFLGHDCSYAYAHHSLDTEDLDRSCQQLSRFQEQLLEDWISGYLEKGYPEVGVLLDAPWNCSPPDVAAEELAAQSAPEPPKPPTVAANRRLRVMTPVPLEDTPGEEIVRQVSIQSTGTESEYCNISTANTPTVTPSKEPNQQTPTKPTDSPAKLKPGEMSGEWEEEWENVDMTQSILEHEGEAESPMPTK